MKKTTEQWRAKAAWKQVHDSLNANSVKEFSTVADGAASLIQKVGFGQAVAFWRAKGGKNENIVKFLSEWLLRPKDSNERDTSKDGKLLMEALIDKDSRGYRFYTNEAIAYLNWVKRFAKARKQEVERGS